MTVGEAFPQELERIRAILVEYIDLGIRGRLGATLVSELLAQAEDAMRQGDAAAMLKLYIKMQKVK